MFHGEIMKLACNLIVILIFILFLFTSCREDNNDNYLDSLIDIDLPEYDNIPVIANVENNFVYTLNANKFTYNFAEYVDFKSDSIIISLTATKINSSESYFVIYDNLNEEIFTTDLNTNKVLVKDNIGGKIPSYIRVKLQDFTGIINIAIAVKK